MGEWDEVDEWKRARSHVKPRPSNREEIAEHLGIDPSDVIHPDRQRTTLAEARIARGFHPKGMKLLGNPCATCGGCAHLVKVKHGVRAFFKCSLIGVTRGAATDIRKKWPACERFAWKLEPGDMPGLNAELEKSLASPGNEGVFADYCEAHGHEEAAARWRRRAGAREATSAVLTPPDD